VHPRVAQGDSANLREVVRNQLEDGKAEARIVRPIDENDFDSGVRITEPARGLEQCRCKNDVPADTQDVANERREDQRLRVCDENRWFRGMIERTEHGALKLVLDDRGDAEEFDCNDRRAVRSRLAPPSHASEPEALDASTDQDHMERCAG
jgi:hypothetical protein